MNWQQRPDAKKYDSGIFKKPQVQSDANPPGAAQPLNAPQPPFVGGSPVPGIWLHKILSGHTGGINRLAYSSDGRHLASPSDDKTIRIWDEGHGECVAVLKGHTASVICAQYTPDGRLLASGSANAQILVWDTAHWVVVKQLTGHTNQINSVAWSANDRYLASGSTDGTIRIWRTSDWQAVSVFKIEGIKPAVVTDLIWQGDEKLISAAGHAPGTVIVWDIKTNQRDWGFGISHGFTNRLVFSTEQDILFSAGDDRTIYTHDMKNKRALTQRLEGHTTSINGLSYEPNGSLLASISEDNTIRLWDTKHLKQVASWNSGARGNRTFNAIEFHPFMAHLATPGQDSSMIHVWKYDIKTLLAEASYDAVRYTTAKLVLVGDTGVGKTGLGWRLAHNEFKEHASTHGQQFWVIPELGQKRDDDTECDAVLWDLAGQHVYRPIHSIFLDNVDAALVLFDPSNRQDPLKGAQFWLEQLKGKAKLPPAILVGARVDRGAPVLSQMELEQFCQKYRISGGYISTSARSGEGIEKLLEKLKGEIPWGQMTATVTTMTFKRIKDYVKSLKENPNRKGVLVRPADLKQKLQAFDEQWDFSDDEMMTAIGHLANHGYVTVLNSSSGEQSILLVPELLASVASSIFLTADKHPRELGSINETDLLNDRYFFDELKGLSREEQQILLDAAISRFMEHNVCFRETYGNESLLIFPSLIKQKRPLTDEFPTVDDVSYIVHGKVENIYASLAVLLGYTSSFTRVNQWQNQAQYETEEGHLCGFRLVEDREGEIELILYYGSSMPVDKRGDFQALFEQFLYQREVEVTLFPLVICPNGHQQERATVVKRVREGKKSLFCDECGAKADLPNFETPKSIGIEASDWLKREEAAAHLRSLYETFLVRIKGFRRGWEIPRCYISHVEAQSEFANRLAHDLSDAGIYVIESTDKVTNNDPVILLDSPAYQKAWQARLLEGDAQLIKQRLTSKKLFSLVTEGRSPILHDLTTCRPGDFCDETHYSVSLFDLIINLYAIPLNHAGFVPLRNTLHSQWEQTLAPARPKVTGSLINSEKEIFVSYAWGGESENLVNQIDQAFQDKGVVITRDKRDLGYRGVIRDFMKRLGHGRSIIVVISDRYLKSKNCMFELLQIAENQKIGDRVFPIVLRDANIYDAVKRLEYIKFWEGKISELDAAMKAVNSANLQGFREEIDLFDSIRDQIAELTDILQNMNTVNVEDPLQTDFQAIFSAVISKLEE